MNPLDELKKRMETLEVSKKIYGRILWKNREE